MTLAFFDALPDITTTSAGATLAMLILGMFGSFITQFLKNRIGTSGRTAVALTALVSGVLATAVLFYTKEVTFGTIFQSGSTIFAVATVIYKFLIDRVRPTPTDNINR